VIEIVSATRLAKADFWTRSALGISLQRLGFDARIHPQIAYENRRGLPEVYNPHIAAESPDDVLVFVHDDVWLNDLYFGDHLLAGLEVFDVVGVAGSLDAPGGRAGWSFPNRRGRTRGSGMVAHGKRPFSPVTLFGPAPAECRLMDGLFLAARRSRLVTHGVRFDPRFDFHFYDLDFCRTASAQGLRLGTWRLNLTHQSGGGYRSRGWRENLKRYEEKWEPCDLPPAARAR
jgi:GT2 family glycosyltransferase